MGGKSWHIREGDQVAFNISVNHIRLSEPLGQDSVDLRTKEYTDCGWIHMVLATPDPSPSIIIDKSLYLLDWFVLKSSQNCESSWWRGFLCGLCRCVIFCFCLLCFSLCVLLSSTSNHLSFDFYWNPKTDKLNHLRRSFVTQVGFSLLKVHHGSLPRAHRWWFCAKLYF